MTAIEKSKLIEAAGGSVIVGIWLGELAKETGEQRFLNSRSFRTVIFNPRLDLKLSPLELNTFVGMPNDTHIERDVNGIIKFDVTLVNPVLDFFFDVHASEEGQRPHSIMEWLVTGEHTRYKGIINYLTKMVGSRSKMMTALLFYGAKGAGKDIIFEQLIAKMYGSYYAKKGAKKVDKTHNGELIRKRFGLWAEIEVTPESIQHLKDMLKSNTVAIRAMYKDTQVSSR